MDQFDTVVVGAGAVGLAIARRFALAGTEVLVLEQNAAPGLETSSHNSEVLHAGLYYPPGSLRARLCLRGIDLLTAYLADNDLPWHRCGKLIVATGPADEAALAAIRQNAETCGAGRLEQLDRAEVTRLEPKLRATSALWSPRTAVFDSHAYMQRLRHEAEAHGAVLALQSRVLTVIPEDIGFVVTVDIAGEADPYRFRARQVINAAGHGAVKLAHSIAGLPVQCVPGQWFARGTYYGLPGRAVFSHLIYPVPEPGGLGIHLTLDMGGAMRFGPDVEWISGIDYALREDGRERFASAIARYWPDVPADQLQPVSCGVRPKISGPGQAAADFRIDGPAVHKIPGLVNLFGIESPGLTSSLAIAEYVSEMIGEA